MSSEIVLNIMKVDPSQNICSIHWETHSQIKCISKIPSNLAKTVSIAHQEQITTAIPFTCSFFSGFLICNLSPRCNFLCHYQSGYWHCPDSATRWLEQRTTTPHSSQQSLLSPSSSSLNRRLFTLKRPLWLILFLVFAGQGWPLTSAPAYDESFPKL